MEVAAIPVPEVRQRVERALRRGKRPHLKLSALSACMECYETRVVALSKTRQLRKIVMNNLSVVEGELNALRRELEDNKSLKATNKKKKEKLKKQKMKNLENANLNEINAKREKLRGERLALIAKITQLKNTTVPEKEAMAAALREHVNNYNEECNRLKGERNRIMEAFVVVAGYITIPQDNYMKVVRKSDLASVEKLKELTGRPIIGYLGTSPRKTLSEVIRDAAGVKRLCLHPVPAATAAVVPQPEGQ